MRVETGKPYADAIALLARREHSALELKQKLLKKGHVEDDVSLVLDTLAQKNLQSDERFAEAYIRMRRRRGFGMERIRLELKERGVSDVLPQLLLQQNDYDWEQHISEVWHQKFRGKKPKHFTDKARQMRFLQYRGFSVEQIQWVWQHADQ